MRAICNHLLFVAMLALASGPAAAIMLPGDLNGDGSVSLVDEGLLSGFYGTEAGDAGFSPAADLNDDSFVDVCDLAIFGQTAGLSGGDVDTTPPTLAVTLNDIPDGMNDVLVVPPDSFEITLSYSDSESVVDVGSLVVTSDRDLGPYAAGSDLGGEFVATQGRATWIVPAGSELERTTHFLTASISDLAGNATAAVPYGFAVRDHPVSGAPLENLQTVFLDFDQDRSLTNEIDFLEDLRFYHLSSTADLEIEAVMRSWVISEILERVHPFFGRNPDGSAGADSANIVFTDSDPGGLRSRLCVGGQSTQGPQFLGSAILDMNNANEAQDDCLFGAFYGVFPQAMDDLWSGDPGYQSAFWPLHPSFGGTPVGEHALDAAVLTPGFDPSTAPTAQQDRWSDIADATDAFAQIVATVIAHETSHMLGLVAHGDAPGGLFGGDTGTPEMDHNVSLAGTTPQQNYLMNTGGSFGFDEISGRNGVAPPAFRAMNWAYLKNRLVLDPSLTGLYSPPTLTAVGPTSTVVYGGSSESVLVVFQGTGFRATPTFELTIDGNPPAAAVLSEVLLTGNYATGYISPFLVPPGLYDVHVRNPDGQVATLADALLVQP